MSKRGYSVAFDVDAAVAEESRPQVKAEGKKHSLDSDEEDSGAEDERRDVLHVDDIEGEEEGVAGLEGEITITPFNMREELEEGHFDTQGHYHWKKEQEIKDSWLDNIDWVKVKGRPEDKYKIHKDDDMKGLGDDSSSDEDDQEAKFDLVKYYKEILDLMKPKETIAQALRRLGASSRISSAERWKRRKAGIVDEGAAQVTRLTELANTILTKTGNMDIYEETYEKISSLLARNTGKHEDAGLDMYAEDFDKKEQASIHGETSSTSKDKFEEEESEKKEIQWEFKWSQDRDAEISGPHSTVQMEKWSSSGHFKTGVWVRKYGEDTQFYTSNRIDFELYL